MLFDAKKIFLEKQARNGNEEAVWALIKYYLTIDAVRCAKFAMMVVDKEPEYCEAKMLEYFGEPINYEDMLGLIIVSYQLEDNWEMADKWVQKYAEYIEIRFPELTQDEREAKKEEFTQYTLMKENGDIDKFENRFMLRWELHRYVKARRRTIQDNEAPSVEKMNGSPLKKFLSKIKRSLAL